MSNLSLPKMTFPTLSGMLQNARLKGNWRVKLAYETTAERGNDGKTIIVRHHGNAIAHIGPDFFTLTGAGWNSRTTADRLNAILRDNQTVLPTEPGTTDRLWYSVSSRDNRKEYGLFVQGRGQDGIVHKLADIQSRVAHFSRVSSDAHYVMHGA